MTTEGKDMERKELTRRKFIAGATAAGIATVGGILGVGGMNLAAAEEPVTVTVNGVPLGGPVPPRMEKNVAIAPVRPLAESLGAEVAWDNVSHTVKITSGKGAVSAATPAWPWKYQKLDPQAVWQAGYDGYYAGACCYGVFSAIIGELRKQVGYPYTLIPVEMFKYGEGGVVGWSTLCGALNGACAAINLVSSEEVYNQIINELMGWYTQAPFPMGKPANPKVDKELATNASGSPLCHVSVTNWCKASGYGAKSPERSERCGRLTGDVAAKAVELLNQYADGKFVAAYKAPNSISDCMSCHGDKAMNNTRGKMDCVQCHDLPNPVGPHK
jgi:hypothetical protein